MRRLSGILTLSMLLLAALAAPALAKGPGFDDHMPVSGTATITGPGLDEPLVATWHGDCLEYCGTLPRQNTFADLVSAAGLFGAMRVPIQATAPRGSLGPKFRVDASVVTKDGGAVPLVFDLYPYAPGGFAPYVTVRPWLHVPSGQHGLFQVTVPAGWRAASPLLTTELRRLGLPSRRAAEVAGRSGLSKAGVAAGVAGFVLLILAGAVAGRPRRRARRSG